jgi:hypothetical protein
MTVTERQDNPEHVRRLAAYSYRYDVASRWRAGRLIGTIGFAACVPIFALIVRDGSSILAALAAGWLVIGRTALLAAEQHSYRAAARLQENYDTQLFLLPWNEPLVGPPPAQADVESDARHKRRPDRLAGWYEVDDHGLKWPADVLLCQWQSAAWSRRDHSAWAWSLIIASAIWTAIWITYATVAGLSLAEFLVYLFLPSAPAVLDAVELATSHWTHAKARARQERAVEEAIAAYRSDVTGAPAAARRLQDGAYQTRTTQPRVPTWFYNARKKSSREITEAGARDLKLKLVEST